MAFSLLQVLKIDKLKGVYIKVAEKFFNSRVINKHDIEENWLKATNFTPKQGEIIVYDIDDNYSYERFKIGDGVHNVNDLPFAGDIVAIAGTSEDPVILANLNYGMYSLDGKFKHFESDENLGTYKKAMIFVQEPIVNMKNIFVFTGSMLVGFTLNLNNSTVTTRHFLNDELVKTLNISALTTEDKTITGAINELKTNTDGQIEQVKTLIGDTSVAEQINTAAVNNQGDWSVNDETSPAYVRNRTHYITDPALQVIAEGAVDTPKWYTNNNVDGVSYCLSSGINSDTKWVEGQDYIVVLNGTQYELTAIKSNRGFMVLGNPYLQKYTADETNTGEEFCIMQFSVTSYAVYFYTENLPESVSFSVSTLVTEIVQLDEKFISYKPGHVIKKGEIYTALQVDGTNVEKTASGNGEIFNTSSNIATGGNAHAEGRGTEATGLNSHAEGEEACAAGYVSHAEGYLTYAASQFQHVQGSFNIIDTEKKYAHIVGNGEYSGSWTNGRSNAHTLDWDGNAWFQGAVKVGGTSQDDETAKELATQEYVDSKSINKITLSDGNINIWEYESGIYEFTSENTSGTLRIYGKSGTGDSAVAEFQEILAYDTVAAFIVTVISGTVTTWHFLHTIDSTSSYEVSYDSSTDTWSTTASSKLSQYMNLPRVDGNWSYGTAGQVLTSSGNYIPQWSDLPQSNWEQYDKTAVDYVQNRTHYINNTYPAAAIDVQSPEANVMYLLQDFEAANASIDSLKTYIASDRIAKCDGEVDNYIGYSVYLKNVIVGTSNGQWPADSDISLIDTVNYKILWRGSSLITYYVILDLSTLTEEYASQFTKLGIYGITTSTVVTDIQAYVVQCIELDDKYIPSDLVTDRNLIALETTDKTVVGAINELYEKATGQDEAVSNLNTLVGDASVATQINDALVNSKADWDQTDETASDYIKNKPDEADAIELVTEMGLVSPLASDDGSIYTDENGALYTL